MATGVSISALPEMCSFVQKLHILCNLFALWRKCATLETHTFFGGFAPKKGRKDAFLQENAHFHRGYPMKISEKFTKCLPHMNLLKSHFFSVFSNSCEVST